MTGHSGSSTPYFGYFGGGSIARNLDSIASITKGQHASITKDRQDTFDVSHAQGLIAREDFPLIICDKDAFWAVFCLEYSRVKNMSREYFSITAQGSMVTVQGREHIIPKIQKTVEQFRVFLQGAQEAKAAKELLLTKICMRLFLVEESGPTVDLSACWMSDEVGIFDSWYRDWIKPCLPQLFSALGFQYSTYIAQRTVVTSTPDQRDVTVIRATPQPSVHLVYPIPPQVILPREDLGRSLYALYQKQSETLCDLELIAANGAIIRAHTAVLFVRGGEVLQQALITSMKEAQEKRIHFEAFSEAVIRAFVEFVYLGAEGLKPEFFIDRELDPANLLAMAHAYQLQPLIDHCTNLISLFATKKDAESIKELAEFYDNAHLRALYAHLSSSPQLQVSQKV